MIELKKEEVEAIVNQLAGMPMNQVENLVGFFRTKLQQSEQPKEEVKLEDVH